MRVRNNYIFTNDIYISYLFYVVQVISWLNVYECPSPILLIPYKGLFNVLSVWSFWFQDLSNILRLPFTVITYFKQSKDVTCLSCIQLNKMYKGIHSISIIYNCAKSLQQTISESPCWLTSGVVVPSKLL